MSTLFAPGAINSLYSDCLWKNNELESNQLKVETPHKGIHCLHRRRITSWQTRIVRTLKYGRSESFRSIGNGLPWQAFRVSADGTELSLHHTDMLIALGMAAGFVSIEERTVEGIDGTVPFVVVEDVRIRNHGFRYRNGRQNFRLKKGWGEVKN